MRVRNISATGAMIESATPVRTGTQPLLELTDAASLSVTVEWAVGDQVGVSFHSPFDLSLLVEFTAVRCPKPMDSAVLPGPGNERAEKDAALGSAPLYELRQELEGFLKH